MAHVHGRGLACAILAAACLVTACGEAPRPRQEVEAGERGDDSRLPAELHDEGYAGSDACADCHARNHETWYASYHRRMTQAASPQAILAPFEGRTPVDEGAAWRLERDGDDFYATPTSASGDRHGERMRVVLTTGSHHYQIYWLDSDELGGLLALPFVWHLGDHAWIPRRSQFLSPPQVETAFELGRWQRVCIKCHTTNGVPDHPPEGAPRVAQFGIACEACHGPGARHAAFRRESEALGELDRVEPDPGVVDPSSLPHERAAMVCGQCHAIHVFRSDEERDAWRARGYDYRPGDDLAATRALVRGIPSENPPEVLAALRDEPDAFAELFWSDGEVRVSGREYNGLVESPCFQRGEMDCLSCHRLHRSERDPRPLDEWASDQLELDMDGSRACTQCHERYAAPEAAAAHSRHAAGSSGSQCMNCHMPFTTYGLTKAIRSHTITSPAVATTVATGRPNACNLCHLDRSLGWTADRLSDWYGQERPDLDADDEEVSAAVVDALAGDAGQRALVAWALGWEPAREVSGTGWMPYLVSTLLVDAYDAVARVALRTARLDPRYAELTLDFTLHDSRRALPVSRTVMADWLRDGLTATPEQRAAVLVTEDGFVDQDRVQSLLGRRDDRNVRLAE